MLAQTDTDYEIMVDDGSADSTQTVLLVPCQRDKSWSEQDKEKSYIGHGCSWRILSAILNG